MDVEKETAPQTTAFPPKKQQNDKSPNTELIVIREAEEINFRILFWCVYS